MNQCVKTLATQNRTPLQAGEHLKLSTRKRSSEKLEDFRIRRSNALFALHSQVETSELDLRTSTLGCISAEPTNRKCRALTAPPRVDVRSWKLGSSIRLCISASKLEPSVSGKRWSEFCKNIGHLVLQESHVQGCRRSSWRCWSSDNNLTANIEY